MNILKNDDVHKNFIALFNTEDTYVYAYRIGIWAENNQPIILKDDWSWNGHYVSRYYYVQTLNYEQVRKYAHDCMGKTSVLSHNFYEIDENNWEDLLEKAYYELKTLSNSSYNVDFLKRDDRFYFLALKDSWLSRYKKYLSKDKTNDIK